MQRPRFYSCDAFRNLPFVHPLTQHEPRFGHLSKPWKAGAVSFDSEEEGKDVVVENEQEAFQHALSPLGRNGLDPRTRIVAKATGSDAVEREECRDAITLCCFEHGWALQGFDAQIDHCIPLRYTKKERPNRAEPGHVREEMEAFVLKNGPPRSELCGRFLEAAKCQRSVETEQSLPLRYAHVLLYDRRRH